MKGDASILDRGKYQKIKSGFAAVLQEARKRRPEIGQDIVTSIFCTLSDIDSFLDETAATGAFLNESMNGFSRTLKHTTIRKLTESFAAFCTLKEKDRITVMNQLKLSLDVEQWKVPAPLPKEAA